MKRRKQTKKSTKTYKQSKETFSSHKIEFKCFCSVCFSFLIILTKGRPNTGVRTMFNQLSIINGNRISDEELKESLPTLQKNVISQMQNILHFFRILDLQVPVRFLFFLTHSHHRILGDKYCRCLNNLRLPPTLSMILKCCGTIQWYKEYTCKLYNIIPLLPILRSALYLTIANCIQ